MSETFDEISHILRNILMNVHNVMQIPLADASNVSLDVASDYIIILVVYIKMSRTDELHIRITTTIVKEEILENECL